jgi:hypothetical protein
MQAQVQVWQYIYNFVVDRLHDSKQENDMTFELGELFLLICTLVAVAAYLNERQKLSEFKTKTHRILIAIAEKEVELVDEDDSITIKPTRR